MPSWKIDRSQFTACLLYPRHTPPCVALALRMIAYRHIPNLAVSAGHVLCRMVWHDGRLGVDDNSQPRRSRILAYLSALPAVKALFSLIIARSRGRKKEPESENFYR